MKIRYGFVANSSTSSFVVLGFEIDASEIPEDDEEYDEFFDTVRPINLEEAYSNFAENKWLVGKWLVDDDESGLLQKILELNEFEQVKKEVEEMKKKFKTAGKIKIYSGTRLT